MNIPQRLYAYAQLLRLHQPIGILLLLWPTLWALWMASHGQPHLKVLLLLMLGVVVMRSAGCAINDFADRKIDGQVKRTKNRPLVTGKISNAEALIISIILGLLGFSLVLLLNQMSIYLSIVGALLIAIYPFTKRYIYFPQIFLGLAFAWGVPMAFAAQTETVPTFAWLVFLIAVLWPVAYDTIYAMVDRDDDTRMNIKSTAILFGKADKLIIALIQLSILGLLFYVGTLQRYGFCYFSSVCIAAALMGYQQYLIRNRDRQACFKAFLHNHWVGLVIFCGLFFNFVGNAWAAPSTRYTFAVAVGYNSQRGFLQIPAGGVPGTSSFERPTLRELGISQAVSYDASINAQFSYFDLYTRYHYNRPQGTRVLASDLTSHGFFLPAGATLKTIAEFDQYYLGVAYPIMFTPRLTVSPLVEVAALDFSYRFISGITISDRHFVQATPRLGFNTGYPLSNNLELGFTLLASIPKASNLSLQTALVNLNYNLYCKETVSVNLLASAGVEQMDFKDSQRLPNHIKLTTFPKILLGLAVTV